MICSGIDNSGRERIFCSFFGGVKDSYVFEIDTDRSFDDEQIPAHVECNPLTMEASSKDKQYDHFFIYGSEHARASLTYSRQINDEDSFSGVHSFKMRKRSKMA